MVPRLNATALFIAHSHSINLPACTLSPFMDLPACTQIPDLSFLRHDTHLAAAHILI